MKIVHLVPGLNEPTNGIAVAAKWIAEVQRKAGHDVDLVDMPQFRSIAAQVYDEAWIHSMWLPITLRACWRMLRHRILGQTKVVRMPHGCLDPVKIRYHYWKKRWIKPLEQFLMRRVDCIVATEEEEAIWIRSFLAPHQPAIRMLDLGSNVVYTPRPNLGKGKFLFVGRLHPLKGLDTLIAAIHSLQSAHHLPSDFQLTIIGKDDSGLRATFEQQAQGLPIRFLGEVDEDVKRREMASSDCLILPTLSENFALVVKESLELGVPVITTDGAKIWKGHPGVTYLDGFVGSSFEQRVSLLQNAIETALSAH